MSGPRYSGKWLLTPLIDEPDGDQDLFWEESWLRLAIAACGKAPEKAAPKPAKVTVTEPEGRAVLEYEELPGRVAAMENVVVKARVTGFLNKVHFEEGAEAEKGRSALHDRPAGVPGRFGFRGGGRMQQAQAQLSQAHSDYQRSMQLSTQKVIATQETEKQGTAALAAEAATRSAQARLAKAKLDLEYTEVRAPISGKISRTNVTEGNLVANGDTLTSYRQPGSGLRLFRCARARGSAMG